MKILKHCLGLLLLLSINPAVTAADKPVPCQTQEYRQFDFWVGQWIVHDAQGKHVGNNHIQSILNGCGLSESWSSSSGFAGVSYNFYDRSKNQWHQTWIDSSGGALYLDGKLDGKVMRLSGDHLNTKGEEIAHQIEWTPLADGRVKQHWRSSSDAGKNWQDVFVGFYSKLK